MKHTYLTPSCEVVQIEIEAAILGVSSDFAQSNSIPSFGTQQDAW